MNATYKAVENKTNEMLCNETNFIITNLFGFCFSFNVSDNYRKEYDNLDGRMVCGAIEGTEKAKASILRKYPEIEAKLKAMSLNDIMQPKKATKSNIMKRAWEIRRNCANELGCKVSEVSMSIAMKMAWAETK